MKVFLRLLSYSFKYRGQFFLGILVSFFVALLNGLSLTAFIPLFDALGDRRAVFEIQFTTSERKVLSEAVSSYARRTGKEIPAVPSSPEKIKKIAAYELQPRFPTGHLRLQAVRQMVDRRGGNVQQREV